ncbi:unnamed protein product [Dracunculus medinensis]|uniref:Nuclear transcription factor Y subunit n=1 Tax=Dracunculus medinensis TaxID=318479 RepID=A0A0N4U3W1_DRAME|nr:unnamed protein product [Dracunculus medinensis]
MVPANQAITNNTAPNKMNTDDNNEQQQYIITTTHSALDSPSDEVQQCQVQFVNLSNDDSSQDQRNSFILLPTNQPLQINGGSALQVVPNCTAGGIQVITLNEPFIQTSNVQQPSTSSPPPTQIIYTNAKEIDLSSIIQALSQHQTNGTPHVILQVAPTSTPTLAPRPEETPLYVNAKQYHRILKRRIARAKLESQGRIPKERRKYLHESRHKHALTRARGQGGKFDSATMPQTNGSSQNGFGTVFRPAFQDRPATVTIPNGSA